MPRSEGAQPRERETEKRPRPGSKVLGVSPSGYYEYLTELSSEFHARCRGSYGGIRVCADLCDESHRGGKKRVARLKENSGFFGTIQRSKQRRREANVRPSMRSVGDDYENAMCERFFANLECDLVGSNRFKNKLEARGVIFEFIEGMVQPSSSSLGEWPSFTLQC